MTVQLNPKVSAAYICAQELNASHPNEPRSEAICRSCNNTRDYHDGVGNNDYADDNDGDANDDYDAASFSTWIAMVDLAAQGTRISGRGDWTDEELYFVVGNKLQDNAAGWWVQMDQELPMAEKTWTHLKAALIRRRSQILQLDCAMGLARTMLGNERWVAQFNRNLDKSTRMLVKQAPVPTTLEQAVDKATAIDDNVARGMVNIGQSWATSPNAYAVPMDGTMGSVAIIPGVGTGSAPTSDIMAAQTGGDSNEVAYFTNPEGVYNMYTGTWDVPNGRIWNGRYWQPSRRGAKHQASRDAKAGGKRGSGHDAEKIAKIRTARAANASSEESASDDAAPPPKLKRRTAVVRRTVAKVKKASAGSTTHGKREASVVRGLLHPHEHVIPHGMVPRGQPNETSDGGGQMHEARTAVVLATRVCLEKELAGRDKERAGRYVATVRPAMRAQRYEWPSQEGRERCLTEEGSETRDGAQAEEGGTNRATREILIDDELNDETMMSLGSMIEARKITKQAKMASTRMRAEQARRRRTDTEPANTVENTITTLGAEAQAKRRLQAELARRRVDGAEPGEQRA
ncbi:unnamed protein product [Phytophthora fragariaefolia]|uniref:Unnamed protein product n=1 Tax=Phytophthora fragariaefolia TaxID=1490495 RepID=A0A9W6Y287_9STRA|nr:unnamed protein product [Phytophthora fragariaefolia]